MYKLSNAFRAIALVICTFAVTSMAQAGVFQYGNDNPPQPIQPLQSTVPISSDLAGGSQPHTNLTVNLMISLLKIFSVPN